MKKVTKQKPEYQEGDQAGKAFEDAMKTLFRAPKVTKKPKKGKD